MGRVGGVYIRISVGEECSYWEEKVEFYLREQRFKKIDKFYLK
jgi:hypothetical protein